MVSFLGKVSFFFFLFFQILILQVACHSFEFVSFFAGKILVIHKISVFHVIYEALFMSLFFVVVVGPTESGNGRRVKVLVAYTLGL